MGYANLKVPFGVGELTGYTLLAAPTSSSSYRLNSSGSFGGGRFSVEKDGIISDVGFYVVSVVSTGTYVASMVETDANNNATDINYGGSSGTLLLPGQISVGWNWITLAQPATGSAGDIVLVRLQAVFADASNYLGMPDNGITSDTYLPVTFGSYSGGTTGTAQGRPLAAMRYNDNHVYGYPVRTGYSTDYTSGSATNYHGMKFSLPFDAVCNGVRFPVTLFDLNSKATLFLYNDTDTILYQKSFGTKGSAAFAGISELMFDEVNLSANTTYRVVIRSDSNTHCMARGLTFITGTYRYTLPNGEYCMKTYRTGTSSYTFGTTWMDDEFSVPYLALLFNQVEYSTGTTVVVGGTTSASHYGWVS